MPCTLIDSIFSIISCLPIICFSVGRCPNCLWRSVWAITQATVYLVLVRNYPSGCLSMGCHPRSCPSVGRWTRRSLSVGGMLPMKLSFSWVSFPCGVSVSLRLSWVSFPCGVSVPLCLPWVSFPSFWISFPSFLWVSFPSFLWVSFPFSVGFQSPFVSMGFIPSWGFSPPFVSSLLCLCGLWPLCLCSPPLHTQHFRLVHSCIQLHFTSSPPRHAPHLPTPFEPHPSSLPLQISSPLLSSPHLPPPLRAPWDMLSLPLPFESLHLPSTSLAFQLAFTSTALSF
jgi:hypothetical protein